MYISGWIVIHKPYMVTVFHWREVIGMVRQLLQLSVPVTMVTYVTCIWLALKWWLSGWVVKGIDWPIKTTKTWPSDWLIWPFMVIVLLHESANIREIVTYLDRFLLVCVHHELQGQIRTCQQTEAVEGISKHPPTFSENTCISLQSYTVYTKKTKAANPCTPSSWGMYIITRAPFSNNNSLILTSVVFTRLWTFCGTYSALAGSSQLNFADYPITHLTLTPCTPFLVLHNNSLNHNPLHSILSFAQ